MATEIGTLDRVRVIIGERGTGKSTLAKIDAREFQREHGGYVIGHSPNGQIGESPDIEFHDDLRRLARGIRRHPEKMHFVVQGPAEDVIDYGERLAARVRKSAFERAHPFKRFREHRPAPPGLKAPPVLVVIDEGVSMKRHPSQDELAELERLLTSARHKHFALTWITQAPTARQWVLLEQASGLRAFRYTHEWGQNGIRAAGIPKDVAQGLRDLPRFSYFEIDKQTPEKARYRMLPAP